MIALAPASCFTCMLGWKTNSSLPFLPFDDDLAVRERHLDVAGHGDRLLAHARHVSHLLGQRVSRPKPRTAADGGLSPHHAQHFAADPAFGPCGRSSRPCDVLRTAMPRPSRTFFSSLRPGIAAARPAGPADVRITFSPSGPYFRYTRSTLPGSPGLDAVLELGAFVLADLVVEDEPSSFSTWAMFDLQLGGLHLGGGPLDRIGVADPGQHVGDRVGHHVSVSQVVQQVRSSTLPACLAHAGDQPVGRLVAEANPADAELAVHGPARPQILHAQRMWIRSRGAITLALSR